MDRGRVQMVSMRLEQSRSTKYSPTRLVNEGSRTATPAFWKVLVHFCGSNLVQGFGKRPFNQAHPIAYSGMHTATSWS